MPQNKAFALIIYLPFQLAAFITLPFDVVKTHQQIELGEKEIYTGKIQHIFDSYQGTILIISLRTRHYLSI